MKSFDYVAEQKLLSLNSMQKNLKYLRYCSQALKVIEVHFPKAAEPWNNRMSSGITTIGFLLSQVSETIICQSCEQTYCLLRTIGNTTNNPRMILNKETAI